MNTFTAELIAMLSIIAFNLGDAFLYSKTCRRHGPQFNYWPGSGYYVAWKYRLKQ